MGERVLEETRDAGGVLRQKVSRVYDSLGQIAQLLDGLDNATSYTYDANFNQLTATDPNGNTTTFAYDALNRVIEALAPLIIPDPNAVDDPFAVAPDALIAAYSFDGDLTDLSGLGNHGTHTAGTLSYTLCGVYSKPGGTPTLMMLAAT